MTSFKLCAEKGLIHWMLLFKLEQLYTILLHNSSGVNLVNGELVCLTQLTPEDISNNNRLDSTNNWNTDP